MLGDLSLQLFVAPHNAHVRKHFAFICERQCLCKCVELMSTISTWRANNVLLSCTGWQACSAGPSNTLTSSLTVSACNLSQTDANTHTQHTYARNRAWSSWESPIPVSTVRVVVPYGRLYCGFTVWNFCRTWVVHCRSFSCFVVCWLQFGGHRPTDCVCTLLKWNEFTCAWQEGRFPVHKLLAFNFQLQEPGPLSVHVWHGGDLPPTFTVCWPWNEGISVEMFQLGFMAFLLVLFVFVEQSLYNSKLICLSLRQIDMVTRRQAMCMCVEHERVCRAECLNSSNYLWGAVNSPVRTWTMLVMSAK